MMKVLLINSAALRHAKNKAVMPLGLLSIAKYLTDNGHIVQIYDRAVKTVGLNKILDTFDPDVVGISALSPKRFPDALNISGRIKKRGLPVVWGGQMPSSIPDLILKSDVVDYVIIGEGEITWLAFLKAIADNTPMSDVAGLAFMHNGTPVINNRREFADLAELPVLDFSFVDPAKYMTSYIECKRMLHLYTSKGCPCQCSFCYNHCFHKHLWRSRPTEYFIHEIKYLIENHGIDGVCFVDDLFGPNAKYTMDVCEKIIKSNLNIVWGCNMQANTMTKDELLLMHKAGCRWILFGIESGSEERQKSIGKNLDLEKAKDIIKYCGEIGIFVTVSCIVGFPDETEEELKQTVKYMRELSANAKFANFVGILPKSLLYEELIKSGRFEAPQSCQQWEKLKWADHLSSNYSKISDRELKVVNACFSWSVLLAKYPNKTTGKDSRAVFTKAVSQTIDIFKSGTFYSIRLLFIAAAELLQIIFYAKFFPQIRKKYGL